MARALAGTILDSVGIVDVTVPTGRGEVVGGATYVVAMTFANIATVGVLPGEVGGHGFDVVGSPLRAGQ